MMTKLKLFVVFIIMLTATACTNNKKADQKIKSEKINVVNYDKISKGMTYEDVTALLGEGEAVFKSNNEALYEWKFQNKKISIIFKNNFVEVIEEEGLKKE